MRARILLCLLLIPAGLGAHAVMNDARFIPSVFFVGDPVRLQITFETSDPVRVDIPPLMPEPDWAVIHDITAETSGETLTVTVFFTSYASGTRTLPELVLGDLVLRDLKVHTQSVIQGSEGIRSVRAQMLIPGTRLTMAVSLTLLIAAPFLLTFILRVLWSWFRRSKKFSRRPERRLKRLIKKLRSGVGTQPPVQWYSELTAALRAYLSSRTGHDCLSATTAEITGMFDGGEHPQNQLIDVLHEGDLVKFAGYSANRRSLTETLDKVSTALQGWDHDQL